VPGMAPAPNQPLQPTGAAARLFVVSFPLGRGC